MSDAIQLRLVDWPLLERLRRHRASAPNAGALSGALEAETYHAGDVADDDAGQWARLPYAIAGPRSLRRDPRGEAREFAKWLAAQSDDDADDALMACAFASGPRELELPDYLLLAWFSPAFRDVAVGLPGVEGDAGYPYDGPAGLPAAIASPLIPSDPSNLLHDPDAASRFHAALARLAAEDGGQGEMGVLYDFIEDNYAMGMELADAVAGSLEILQRTYAEAARHGFGVLVTNG